MIKLSIKEKIIIWGTGHVAEEAFWDLRSEHEIMFFIDSNPEKQRELFYGRKVYSPEVLNMNLDACVVIGSTKFEIEIYNALKNMGILNVVRYAEWKKGRESGIKNLLDELNKNRSIDLGKFLMEFSPINLGKMTFFYGGSGVLDYAFLYALAKKFNIRSYLEIGSYIGESINLMAGLCDVCYSMTAEPGSIYSMRNICKQLNIPDYSERLSYKDNIKHIYCNSQEYDFTLISDDIDMYFIDADHSYQGVYIDTKNVFAHKHEGSIVVWHDFVTGGGYNDVAAAVSDFLGEEEFKNVYCTDNNMCGIYLPKEYQGILELHSREYLEGAKQKLYTYDTVLTVDVDE